jgi:hypothetical protein
VEPEVDGDMSWRRCRPQGRAARSCPNSRWRRRKRAWGQGRHRQRDGVQACEGSRTNEVTSGRAPGAGSSGTGSQRARRAPRRWWNTRGAWAAAAGNGVRWGTQIEIKLPWFFCEPMRTWPRGTEKNKKTDGEPGSGWRPEAARLARL